MTTFDDREKAAENRFALDEELRFKASARRNKLIGLWAAGLLGKTGEEADAYAKAVVLADFEEVGEEDVFRKLRADLDVAKASDEDIRQKMHELMAKAVVDIRSGQ